MFGRKKRKKDYTELTTNLQNIAPLGNVNENNNSIFCDIAIHMRKIFIFIKEWWILISFLLSLFVYAVAIRGYVMYFSGNTNAAVEYVNAFIIGGSYKWIFFIAIAGMIFLVRAVIPIMAIDITVERYNREWENFGFLRKVITLFIAASVQLICEVVLLHSVQNILGSSEDFTLLWWTFFCVLIVSFLLLEYPEVSLFGYNGKTPKNVIFAVGLLIIFAAYFLFPYNPMDLLNRHNDDYVSCIKDTSNPNNPGVDALPVSYDSRGVQVFTGEYDSKSKKWKNDKDNKVHRKYLQFDKGYQVLPGACESYEKSGSASDYSEYLQ
ncbi:hypothetical protein [Rothia dentocariosa]|uniref:hypothetical protein n=1 Tax=Rothia dentocariosa TaxID=2047 RepID=UPI0028EC4F15|nr:hypothetical protein [Rothia dentocariosa]